MRGFPLMVLALGLAPIHVAAETDAVCVGNGSHGRLFFAAEAGDGTRKTEWLDPGAKLCSGAANDATGLVSVFVSPEEFEGCSRLSSPGEIQWLEKYTGIDVCLWRTE